MAPPLWPNHENFLQATLYEKVRFLPFFSKFHKKMGEFATSIERSKAKSVSASPTSAPGPRWGLRPQTPLIGSRSVRSPWPPLCQILNTPLVETYLFCGRDWRRVLPAWTHVYI